jgi:membrane-associated phospholipid phosphatase
MNVLGRPAWLTDLASAAYVSFYSLPIGLALLLYFGGRRSDYHPFVFTVALAFFLPFFGYLVVPATGPRLPSEAIGGGAVSAGVQSFLGVVEKNLFDAFPSGHTAVTLVVVACGWRLLPRWRWRVPLLTMGALIVFATVYLSLHYVVDVAAGAAVAVFVMASAPRLYALFSPRSEAAVDVQLGTRHV